MGWWDTFFNRGKRRERGGEKVEVVGGDFLGGGRGGSRRWVVGYFFKLRPPEADPPPAENTRKIASGVVGIVF